MIEHPLVSIVINNHNYGRFLGEAIDSAISQKYPHTEVIVVDDGSTDNSRAVIAGFGERIHPVLQANGGQSSAINAGVAVSRGGWIHLLDADDVFYPHKLGRIAELATEYPTAGMIAHNLDYCNVSGDRLVYRLGGPTPPSYILQRKLVDDRRLARRGKLSTWLTATSGLSIRRDVLGHLMPVPEQILVGTDNYLKIAILSLFPVLQVPDALAKQRLHGDNRYTMGHGADKRLAVAQVDAILAFYLKKNYPHLGRLAWKQYGRVLHSLRSCGTAEARRIEHDIRASYSVIDSHPECLFYVAAAYTKAATEAALRDYRLRAKRISSVH
jgi:glycosyltransferase involved in cell wall biosynthesis